MTEQNTRLGIILMVITMLIFAIQDAFSKHLASEYNVFMVVMVRYWFFALFVLALARRQGGIRAAARTDQLGLQIGRGVLLVAEICVMVAAFTLLGLIESFAVFACYPLLVAALSGPILGERVGPWRLMAIVAGFIGMLIVLQPGAGAFSIYALIPLCSATMFALYALLTRFASRRDTSITSFFWTGIAGTVAITPVGLFFWEPMTLPDWGWMLALCISGALGHWLLIKVYELAEAGAVQPFAYLHLVFGALVGLLIFSESLRTNVVVGAGIIIGAGLFTIWREQRAKPNA